MGDRLVQAGSAFTAFLGVSLVAFGGYRVYYGTGTVEELYALAVLAVAVVAGYRSLAIHAGSKINAVGNTALFFAAAATYGGGVNLDADPVRTAGQALFLIAVAYFVVRLD